MRQWNVSLPTHQYSTHRGLFELEVLTDFLARLVESWAPEALVACLAMPPFLGTVVQRAGCSMISCGLISWIPKAHWDPNQIPNPNALFKSHREIARASCCVIKWPRAWQCTLECKEGATIIQRERLRCLGSQLTYALLGVWLKLFDKSGTPLIKRHILNDRNQCDTRLKYKITILKHGYKPNLRNEMVVVPASKGSNTYLVLSGAHLIEAIYEAYYEAPGNPQVQARLSDNSCVCKNGAGQFGLPTSPPPFGLPKLWTL